MTLSHSIGLTCWEQGCGKAFLGDSLRSPRPCDLLACQLASRREDHGQVSIIMTVCFRTVPVRSPTSTAPLRAGQGDLTDCRRAGLPVRPRPAASCQPDRVEERHPLRRDQDRPLQAQDARLLACISTRILSVPYCGQTLVTQGRSRIVPGLVCIRLCVPVAVLCRWPDALR